MYRRLGSRIAIAVFTVIALAHSAVADDDAARLYKSKCSSCHGKTGDGKTTTGKKLGVADWTTKGLGGWSDAELRKIILAGVKGSDNKWRMAPFPKLTDAELAGVIAYVRSLAKK